MKHTTIQRPLRHGLLKQAGEVSETDTKRDAVGVDVPRLDTDRKGDADDLLESRRGGDQASPRNVDARKAALQVAGVIQQSVGETGRIAVAVSGCRRIGQDRHGRGLVPRNDNGAS